MAQIALFDRAIGETAVEAGFMPALFRATTRAAPTLPNLKLKLQKPVEPTKRVAAFFSQPAFHIFFD
jgi:hypothetical protein